MQHDADQDAPALEEQPIVTKARRRVNSPYLWSSLFFTLSALVSTGLALETCVANGWTKENIGNLASNVIYVVAYAMYVRAEYRPATLPQSDAMPLLNSPMIQRL
jgi:hypothetical protein